MVFPSHGMTAHGLDALLCAKRASEAGCDCFGTNCGRGVKAMLQALEHLSPVSREMPLSAFPNAGIPEVMDFRMVYSTPPSYMAEKVMDMVRMGVRLVGGCCGTTPAHIYEFKKRLHVRSRKAVTGPVRSPRAPARTSFLIPILVRVNYVIFVFILC
jgi:homocysteine S-methyltransferase